ncbi:PstS family phosphate ABC transporter substrate-binding protein [Aphanothece sacrum]|nr:PstS family phosphate ABC transporter substrate-binding protein [Aphanothece sacrum]
MSINNCSSYFIKKLGLSIASVALLSACGQVSSKDIQSIKIDGSSTVNPITQAIVKYHKIQPSNKQFKEIKIDGEFSGTGGGFKKFCAGETDINAASRPISPEEMQACDKSEVRYIELPIAFDAITLVVNRKNKAIDTLTVVQLKTIWEPKAQVKITHWNQVDSAFPNQPLTLYGPDKKSGTYDYFTQAIMGQEQLSRQDYVFSADDEAIANGVIQDTNALGYFGFAYYQEHKDKLKAVAIDNGQGAMLPSRETVENGQYQPLARPLFIYVNAKKAQENPALEEFVKFYLDKAPELVSKIGYIPLPEEGYHLAKIHFQRLKVGTVFEGKHQTGLTIGDLLRKQAKF